MTIPYTTQTHDDFYEWLDSCPVQWVRKEVSDEGEFGFSHFVYLFILPADDTN